MKESEQDVELRSGTHDSAERLGEQQSEEQTPQSVSTPGELTTTQQECSIASQNPFDNS